MSASPREHDAMVHRDAEGNVILISLIVHGRPKPQGSKRHVGHGVLREQVKGLDEWRKEVAREMRTLGVETQHGPLHAELTFYIQRPKKHFGSGRNANTLRADAPQYQTSYPDVDKLARAILDAMTQSALIRDDGQVAVLICMKLYAPTPGVHVKLRPL